MAAAYLLSLVKALADWATNDFYGNIVFGWEGFVLAWSGISLVLGAICWLVLRQIFDLRQISRGTNFFIFVAFVGLVAANFSFGTAINKLGGSGLEQRHVTVLKDKEYFARSRMHSLEKMGFWKSNHNHVFGRLTVVDWRDHKKRLEIQVAEQGYKAAKFHTYHERYDWLIENGRADTVRMMKEDTIRDHGDELSGVRFRMEQSSSEPKYCVVVRTRKGLFGATYYTRISERTVRQIGACLTS